MVEVVAVQTVVVVVVAVVVVADAGLVLEVEHTAALNNSDFQVVSHVSLQDRPIAKKSST